MDIVALRAYRGRNLNGHRRITDFCLFHIAAHHRYRPGWPRKSSRSRERKIETFLLYLFGIGVAGSGIGGFFGHFFISDSVAKSIGWPTGNLFQLEVGFANLAIGILGIIANGPPRRLP